MMKLTQKEIDTYMPYHTYYEFLCGFNQSSRNGPNITKETYDSFSELGRYIYELGRECAYRRRVLDRWKSEELKLGSPLASRARSSSKLFIP